VVERVLTRKELNRATLARQLLLRRKRIGTVAAVERLAGLQAQWPPAPYVGLWSRVEGFKRASLERALVKGDVVKATVMRGTLHLVSLRDYPVFWEVLHQKLFWSDEAAAEKATRVATSLRELALAAPITMKDALAHLETEHGVVDVQATRTWFVARVRGHLLHHPETALWTARPQGRYAALAEPERVDRVHAVTELVRRYLTGFGPASKSDIARWSGLNIRDFQAGLDALEPLVRFRDEKGRELCDLPRLPLPAADTPAPVRFLPKWDNVILGFDDRERILPKELQKTVIAKNGDVVQTFLVDGVVAGSWSSDPGGKVTIAPYAPLPRTARREVEEEAARLEGWLR
jgi:hypothetical protein